MKKFTKVCLITALILFLIGCAMAWGFGVMGGYRQLEQMEQIAGIPFQFGYDDGDFRFGFFRDEDWENGETIPIGEKKKLDISAGDLKELNLWLGACNLNIEKSEDENVWIAMGGNTDRIHYRIDGGTLEIEDKGQYGFRSFIRGELSRNRVVNLYLPEDIVLDTVDIGFGAGQIDSIPLAARQIDVEAGAGVCRFREIEADTLNLSIGAGKMNIDRINVREADVEVGAGEFVADEMNISGYIDLNVGMGNVNLYGTIEGDMDAECGMGSLAILLTGSQEDHNYVVECSMGDTTIGDSSYSGLANEKTIANNSSSDFDIECSMGSVVIVFEE